jgi:predicted methyltransferase
MKTNLLVNLLIAFSLLFATFSFAEQDSLKSIIESRDDKDKARDSYRNPAETLAFFRVEPGMSVAEVLPGGGWYTKILAPFLGKQGKLIALNYNDSTWSLNKNLSPEFIEKRIASTAKFPETVRGFAEDGPEAMGYTFETVPESLHGTLDRVLIIRGLHNLNRYESIAQTRSQALSAIHSLLKEDGYLGVVQHRDKHSNGVMDGSRGYLQQQDVIEFVTQAGFDLVAASELNANPNDKPEAKDRVWRLPPSFSGSRDNPEKKAKMATIGESDRMTLLFKKK